MTERGEQAFPLPDGAAAEGRLGMSLRDYFAAAALQGFCANPSVFAPSARNGWGLVNCTDLDLIGYCGRLADHAIKEGSK